jgi:hypothetical protein
MAVAVQEAEAMVEVARVEAKEAVATEGEVSAVVPTEAVYTTDCRREWQQSTLRFPTGCLPVLSSNNFLLKESQEAVSHTVAAVLVEEEVPKATQAEEFWGLEEETAEEEEPTAVAETADVEAGMTETTAILEERVAEEV